MAETAVETPTFEQELTSAMNPETPEVTPAPEAKTETPAPAEEAKVETPVEATDLEAKLKEIPDAPEEKAEVSTLTPDQQQIFQAFPTTDAARQAITEASYYRDLNTAIVNGDFETVEQAFAPEALEGFKEHFYKKYATDIVDRWIAEQDGTAPVVKGLSGLEAKIARLEAKLAEKESSTAQETQKAQAAQLQTNYHKYLDGMFDKFQFSPADRRYVAADVTSQISSNPKLMQAYRSGNMEAFNTVVKTAIREYSTKDQAQAKQTQAVIANQERKKDLVGGTATVADTLPDDIKDVPKGKEDAWMTEKLTRLFRGK